MMMFVIINVKRFDYDRHQCIIERTDADMSKGYEDEGHQGAGAGEQGADR